MSKALHILQEAYNLPSPPTPFSSVTGFGRKDIWRVIRKGIVGEPSVPDDEDDDEIDEDLENGPFLYDDEDEF
jgi:hypothetical protein